MVSRGDVFRNSPIIAGIRHTSDIEQVLQTPVNLAFLLAGDILQLKESAAQLTGFGKKVFIHMDMVKGLGKDDAAVEFVAREIKAAGIITTRASLVGSARKHNLLSVQRLFLLDSTSLTTGLELVRNADPDCVEVLPGIIPRMIVKVKQSITCPIVAGGLIQTEEDIVSALKAGAVAVSVGDKSLWNIKDPGHLYTV